MERQIEYEKSRCTKPIELLLVQFPTYIRAFTSVLIDATQSTVTSVSSEKTPVKILYTGP